jgi:hypothetical protein
MSGCDQYHSLLEVLAQKLSNKEISALFSQASQGLVNTLSEVTSNLCCIEGVLTESQRAELAPFRAYIKIIVSRKQSFKNRRKLYPRLIQYA